MVVRDSRSTHKPEASAQPIIPTLSRPTPDEIERRTRLFERARAIREAIGPVGIHSDDLIHEARRECGR